MLENENFDGISEIDVDERELSGRRFRKVVEAKALRLEILCKSDLEIVGAADRFGNDRDVVHDKFHSNKHYTAAPVGYSRVEASAAARPIAGHAMSQL